MTRHDTSPERSSPYQLVFGPTVFESDWFPSIAAEAEARGIEARDAARFVMLGSVGNLMRALRPEINGGAQLANDIVSFYGALAFHAFHFWREGHVFVSLDEAALRPLLDASAAIGAWTFTAPKPAGYLQLPRHLVWTRIHATAPAEPIDGWFWVVTAERIELLLCTGVRTGRAGFGVIEASAALPAPPPGHWGDIEGREAGDDFANVLPGGELGNLYAVINQAEVLKLVSRGFWRIGSNPDSIRDSYAATRQDTNA